MKIASLQENKKIEKRIAITPEITKKYVSNGFEVFLSKNYGQHLGFSDDEYKNLGAKIIDDEKEIVKSADLIVQLGLPSDENLSYFKDNQIITTTKERIIAQNQQINRIDIERRISIESLPNKYIDNLILYVLFS